MNRSLIVMGALAAWLWAAPGSCLAGNGRLEAASAEARAEWGLLDFLRPTVDFHPSQDLPDAMPMARESRSDRWSRLDDSTLKLEGSIEGGAFGRFSKLFGPDIRELVVDSDGGRTDESIRIGLELAQRDVKVVVTGQCLSSCANYFFTAGRRREIRGGIVGFHGNVTACFADEQAEVEEMRRHGFTDQEIAKALAQLREEKAGEARLLGLAGVSQELFDRSCRPDRERAWLLPTRSTFERYGLHGVAGEQDPEIARRLLGEDFAIE